MASTRKSRTLNKRISKVNEESPDKDGSKSKPRRRKLSDMLGSQWSKEELGRFYDAYRKHGKDWRKVAAVVRNRSIDMVEALYNMNRAYLSLPEGTASVVGLIAMMTDHYNIMEGSDSERESNDVPGISRKPQKRGRGKFPVNISRGSDAHVPDLLQFPSLPSSNGGLSLLRKKRSGGSRPRAVGKRTPRFPVSYLYDKQDREQFVSPNKRGSRSDLDANDDEVAHGAVLVLAEALQRGGSPQISQAPNRRSDLVRPSPVRNRDRVQAESQKVSARFIGIATDEDGFEGSLGSREAESGDFTRDSSYMMDTEGFGTVEVNKNGKKFHGKKSKIQGIGNNFDDVREACSGTEEGLILSSPQERVDDDEVTYSKLKRSSPQSSRKRSRQILFDDESAALDALCTLADVSMKFAPASTVESEASVQFKEDKRSLRLINKSSIPEATSAKRQKDKPKSSGPKEKGLHLLTGVNATAFKNTKLGRDSAGDISSLCEAKNLVSQSTTKVRKGKGKSLGSKILKGESPADSRRIEPQKTEVLVEDGKKSMSKAKRVGVVASFPKQGRSFKSPEQSSSNTDPLRPGNDSSLSTAHVPTINQVSLPTKLRSRRKMDLPKALVHKELSSPENIGNDRSSKCPPSHHDRTLDHKEKLSHCLSSQILRRWCAFEWFYSAIDYPWFAKREFVEYLNHVGLGHVPRLTRVEWGVIRSSLGKPRRLSQQFLREEKEKLDQYRESVRTHYTELRAGIREGLPTDLARPLSVGQRVIACHPKTREFHDGNVLTVDRNRCRIQFDRPEFGVEFVMDIDCMPLNPLENMPEALRRQNVAADRLYDFSEPKMTHLSKDWKPGGHLKVASTENPEIADTSSQMSLPANPLNTLLTQAKGDTINAISQAKAAVSEIVNAQKAAHSHPCTLVQKQAREADIRALSEVTRALDKKQALVLELKHMNDDVNENRKDGENCLKDYEPFKRQYATVLVQLKEVNEQVTSALTYLRQRNTYQGNSPPWQRPKSSTGAPVGLDQTAFLTPESGSHVVQILESSRLKAQAMVDIAVQAMSSLKEGEEAFASIGLALDSASNHHGIDFGCISSVRSFPPADLCNDSLANQDAASSCTSEPTTTVNVNGTKLNNPDRSEMQIPKELVCSCVATLLMIQTCTERQYPPAEVAQILDSAVTSLQPCCSENFPIYREIQMCMGLVKNQILALIPT